MNQVKYRFFLLLVVTGALLSARGAAAQCATPNPPACTFEAFDVQSQQRVEAFCVGRAVEFRHCDVSVPSNLLRYGVRPGANNDYFTATPRCEPPNALPYAYTPTRAEVGTVTVSELANSTQIGQRETYYVRNYRVYDNLPPAFTLVPCLSGLVQVTVTDATYDTYSVQVGPAPPVAVPRNQAVVLPVPGGATTVTVTGQYAPPGLCTNSSTLPIPTLAPAQVPLFTSLTLLGPLPGGAATLAVGQLPAGYVYTLQLADNSPGGFQRVADVPAGSTSFALPAPVAGCYRLLANDVCNSRPTPSLATICPVSLTSTSARNRNQLLLTPSPAGTTFSVTRNGLPLGTFTQIPGGLEDADVQCGTDYTYVVSARQPGGGLAISNPSTVTTVSDLLPPQPQLLASFNANNVVELTPLLATSPLPAGSSLSYRRSAGSAAPALLSTATTARVQRDSTVLNELRANPPCYSVRLTDVCGNVSPESAATCPALLSATPADPDGSSVALTWSAFTGPAASPPASYTLQRLAADGTVLSAVPVSGGRFLDLTPPPDRQVLRYRLLIAGAGLSAGFVSYSNRASSTRRVQLTIPTAFTPNGDGLNDVLEIKGKYLRAYTFVVVDRNGQEVFRGTQRTDTWDGTIAGHAPVLGTYVWRFQQDDEENQRFTATGTVNILK